MPSNSSKRIDDGLRQLSREVLPPGHMDAMMECVRSRVRRKDRMNTLIRRTALAAGLSVALLVGLLVVPVSYNLHVGSLVLAEIPAIGENVAFLSGGLPHMDGLMHSSAEQSEGDIILRLGFWGKSADEARAMVAEALAGLPAGTDACGIEAEDIVQRIGGNVLAWASGGRLVVHGEGMTEEELEQAILEALIANGASEADVDVELKGEGIGRISISVGDVEGAAPGDSGFTIEIISGDGSTVTSD